MSDIFEPFAGTSPPVAHEADKPKSDRRKVRAVAGNGAEPKKRGRKAKSTAAPSPQTEAAPVKKRGRQPGTVASLKVDLATVAGAMGGMSQEDAHLFAQMAKALQKSKKGSRDHILAALGKVFV